MIEGQVAVFVVGVVIAAVGAVDESRITHWPTHRREIRLSGGDRLSSVDCKLIPESFPIAQYSITV